MLIAKICCCMFTFLSASNGDTFTSIREMERLFDLEQHLVKALDDYLRHANFELEVMERHYTELSKIDSEITDIDSYAENPVNAYSVIKRMIKEWPSTFNLMSSSPFFEEDKELPAQHYLTEMINALVEWQLKNKLETERIARGWVEGIKPHANLTANDCFDIGVFCYNTKQMSLAVEWLREAYYKIKNNKDHSASLVEVLEYVFLAKCRAGDTEGSVTVYQALITDGAKWYTPSKELKKEYNRQSVKRCVAAALETKKSKPSKTGSFFKNYDISHDLCRPSTKVMEGLVCYYEHHYNYYLMMQPIQVEELSLTPFLALIHDAVNHDEILDIKESTLTILKTLTMGANGPVSLPSPRIIKRLNKRMSNFTAHGYSKFSEGDSMVSVFGPDTGYKTFITFDDEELKGKPIGQIIYFLSDVAKGGYTIFPSPKVAVTPRRGSILFYMREEGEPPLVRGECPVFIGSKWMMTKTLSEGHQEQSS